MSFVSLGAILFENSKQVCPLIRLSLWSDIPMDAFDCDVVYMSTKESKKLEEEKKIGLYREAAKEEEEPIKNSFNLLTTI